MPALAVAGTWAVHRSGSIHLLEVARPSRCSPSRMRQEASAWSRVWPAEDAFWRATYMTDDVKWLDAGGFRYEPCRSPRRNDE